MYLGLETVKSNPGIDPGSPALRADSFTTEPPGKPITKSLTYALLSSARMQRYPQETEEAQTDRRSRSGSVSHFVQVARWRASPGVACTPESTHVLSAPLGLFCSTWSRQRCSDVLMDTPSFHFFKYSHFCKQYNFRAQLLGGTLTQTSFPGCLTLSVCLPWTIIGWCTGN